MLWWIFSTSPYPEPSSPLIQSCPYPSKYASSKSSSVSQADVCFPPSRRTSPSSASLNRLPSSGLATCQNHLGLPLSSTPSYSTPHLLATSPLLTLSCHLTPAMYLSILRSQHLRITTPQVTTSLTWYKPNIPCSSS
jgi:hypothetical protein